jgi:hypothetical protein
MSFGIYSLGLFSATGGGFRPFNSRVKRNATATPERRQASGDSALSLKHDWNKRNANISRGRLRHGEHAWKVGERNVIALQPRGIADKRTRAVAHGVVGNPAVSVKAEREYY